MEAGRLTLLDRSAIDRLLPIAVRRGIGVITAGVFNSGVLVDPVANPFYEYKPAPPDVREAALRLRDVCASFGVRLADAAVQFPLRTGADAVVVGARTPDEVDAFVDGLDVAVPTPLWESL
jgi:D-threo-aldose 1-dehydrogenase